MFLGRGCLQNLCESEIREPGGVKAYPFKNVRSIRTDKGTMYEPWGVANVCVDAVSARRAAGLSRRSEYVVVGEVQAMPTGSCSGDAWRAKLRHRQ